MAEKKSHTRRTGVGPMGGGKEIENRLNRTFNSGDGVRWRKHIGAAKNPVGSGNSGYIKPGRPKREPASGAGPAW